ncbi:MAG: cobalamin biosynthesis protein CbiD, partial [Muribaculaceae bacterium]|nr:cobalamin biosynthesis protein CbiD [Muribaculaceae bacterium]
DESGAIYYYSTRSDVQDIQLAHGVRLTGTMELAQMKVFSLEHDIALIIDATHPFAQNLHYNVVNLAQQLGVPLIRVNRIFPPHDADLVWCRDYDDAISQLNKHNVERLIAFTGVNTIGKLKDYWQHNECWFRILDRDESREATATAGFPQDHLVYYEPQGTKQLLKQLHPQAIITKESGTSGGFVEKVDAARRNGVLTFVVECPPYPSASGMAIEHVNGPHGLRRAVEKLLPEFYPLHSGITTGTCATAAAIAATTRLTTGETPSVVAVVLPNGETIQVPVIYGDGYASVFKESGDDPDITNGIEIRASVTLSKKFEILGGEGVGTFTVPGFDYPPGEPAINKGPRQMMRKNIKQNVRIVISVPEGAAKAKRTFNPRLGIEGGISIIGVSGIVKPFSEEAFIESIRKCMQVAKASGAERVVINSGGKSERFVKTLYPELPQQAFVEYGNYIGETLSIANELGIKNVTLGVMLGKAVKLAAGNLDTHSRRSTMDKDFISSMLHEAGCDIDISSITLARELWEIIPQDKLQAFATVVINHCMEHCSKLLPNGKLLILMITNDGVIYG